MLSATQRKITTGTKVAYSVQFLKSIGMSHSDMAHARGVVTALGKLGQDTILATINCGQGLSLLSQSLPRACSC